MRSPGDDESMEETPILICYDASPGAVRAVEAAASLLGPRRAVVLNIEPPLSAAESVAALDSVVPGNAFEQLNAAEAGRIAEQGADLARSLGFEAEPRSALAATTWEGIIDAADDVDASIIVIGSRGLNAFTERLKGGVSHRVAEHARRPVLVVPPSRDGR
jgi:nucleotide-binding universal stress UspA family protein